mmetsp:Transcript_80730/g.142397  ORF Transcript_80730/g.142397 Transcript_80730/m.142397 type:complete len:102 (+) Transcript_80730:900-1205(+)
MAEQSQECVTLIEPGFKQRVLNEVRMQVRKMEFYSQRLRNKRQQLDILFWNVLLMTSQSLYSVFLHASAERTRDTLVDKELAQGPEMHALLASDDMQSGHG